MHFSNHFLRCCTRQLGCCLQCIPSFELDKVFDSNAVSAHSRNALQDGNYILFVTKEHSWEPKTSGQHCRILSLELVCIAWCSQTFFFSSWQTCFSFGTGTLSVSFSQTSSSLSSQHSEETVRGVV